MPNTPALIGQGISGLYARGAVTASEHAEIEAVLASTGRVVWVDRESDLDAVTALSGSGPAYVFYVAEAMVRAAVEMGLSPPRVASSRWRLRRRNGAAQASEEGLDVLRERVTSKGGTTHAALVSLESSGVADAFVRALQTARERARELGDQFG
jgi:pyrroline-5-carboxylate reductase